jgi:peptidoglycan hydrolase-like protein with peptidoglycan-binding domain
VVAWQNALNRWLRLAAPTQTALTADGNFGAGTQTATEQLQTAAGLTPDGVVGASTRRALQQALAAGKTSSTQTTPAAATLKLGDTGSAVVSWQNQLNRWLKNTAATQPPLTADGSFGSSTQTVTEQFQSAAQLTPTGQVDAATQRAMTAALARSG